MWRVARSGGLLLALALGALAAGCGDDSRPLGIGVAVGGASSTAGAASGGTFNINLAGSLTIAGQAGTSEFCSGPIPHFAPNRWSIADLDGSLDLVFGPGPRLADALNGEATYQRDRSAAFVQALLKVARARVRSAAQDAAFVERCDVPDDTNADCLQTWLKDYGLQLYRRPLADVQVEAFALAYQSALGATDAVQAAENVLVSMILSPYFVLRIELGTGDGSPLLSQYEIASRISHFAARRAPDLELRSSAAAGELAVPQVAVQHLHRLWSTPEGRAARELTFLEWLGVQHPNSRADLAPELRADMDAQLRGFITDVFDSKNGALEALLAGSRFPINARLAKHYGLSLDVGEDLELRELEPSVFAGLLTTGAFLSRVASPSQRGLRIESGLFCGELPTAPSDAHLEPLPPAATPRDQLTLGVKAQAKCQACHQFFDPLGLALSAFDGDARLSGWDSSSVVPASPGSGPVAVSNPQGLANAIASSLDTRECVGRRYLELLVDRPITNTMVLKVAQPRPPRSAERQWLDCFSQTLSSGNPSLITFAELLVVSPLMRWRDDAPHRLLAFDSSADPLEHAYQEALQLDDAYPNPDDAALITEYARSLQAVREPTPPGAGGAGGEGVGGAGGAP